MGPAVAAKRQNVNKKFIVVVQIFSSRRRRRRRRRRPCLLFNVIVVWLCANCQLGPKIRASFCSSFAFLYFFVCEPFDFVRAR
jgi:hypothetical protein